MGWIEAEGVAVAAWLALLPEYTRFLKTLYHINAIPTLRNCKCALSASTHRPLLPWLTGGVGFRRGARVRVHRGAHGHPGKHQ